jgi:hypothetical protein
MAVKKASKKPRVVPESEADWPATLRTGPEGVALWNARPPSARQLTRLGHGDYAGCDLAGIDFTGQSVLKFQAAGADLTGALLTRGSFIEGDFRDADLSYARMAKFGGRDGDFRGAKLVGVDLTSGRLARARFAGADLTRADLTGADVVGADFTGATLTDATLADLVSDSTTVWPEGFTLPAPKWSSPPGVAAQFAGSLGGAVNIDGFMARLCQTFDPKRIARTLDMLRTGRNQLFAEVEEARVFGVVRSQREPDLVYSCVLADDGTYSCCTPNLMACMGLRGEPCKHLLVLLIGLARAGKLDATTADHWVAATRGKEHSWSEALRDRLGDTLLKLKGAEAGEIDWRPTETIPEDFYSA